MKFGVLYESQMVEDWAHLYVDYERLKTILERFDLLKAARAAASAEDDEEVDEDEQFETRNSFLMHEQWYSNVLHKSRNQGQPLPLMPSSEPVEEQGGKQGSHDGSVNRQKQRGHLLLPPEMRLHHENAQRGRHDDLLEQPLLDSDNFEIEPSSAEIQDAHQKLCSLFLEELEVELLKADAAYTNLVCRLQTNLSTLEQHANIVMLNRPCLAEVSNIKSQFVHLFRQSTQLLNFALLNFQASQKITKKFIKVSGLPALAHVTEYVDGMEFVRHSDMPSLMKRTIAEYARHFEHNDETRAKIGLLSRMTEMEFSRKDCFRLGLKVGAILVMVVWTIVLANFSDDSSESERTWNVFRPMYRCSLTIAVLLWSWGLLLYVWQRARVNFVYIFEFDPSSRLTFFAVWDEAANLTLLALANFCVFSYAWRQHSFRNSTISLLPRALFVFVPIKLFAPFSSHWKSRRVLLNTLSQVIRGPFGRFRFLEFFVTDVLTSLVKPLVDLASSICVSTWVVDYATCSSWSTVYSPVLTVLPLLLRFLQCCRRYYDTGERFPNLPNAAKYALAHAVVLCSVIHPLALKADDVTWTTYRIVFLFFFVVSTIFTSMWDIFVDWGLDMRCSSSSRQLLYNRRLFYVVAAIINVVFRFFWTISLVPTLSNPFMSSKSASKSLYQDLLLPLLIVAELLRRMLWAMIRVENEHIGNVDDFRSHDVPLPMYFDSQRELQRRKLNVARQSGLGLVSELALMAAVLIGLAIIGAVANVE